MLARFPRLRWGPRPRTADDDDWGTSSPTFVLDMEPEAVIPPEQPPGADPVAPKPGGGRMARLKQQELASYVVTFSPRVVITLYFGIAVAFLVFGSALAVGTGKVRGHGPVRYSNNSACADSPDGMGEETTCKFELLVDEVVPAPSYFYYSLKNFHQNARKYAKSRSDVMNQGQVPGTFFDVSTCDPLIYKDLMERDEENFDASDLRYPCGLTAHTFFNDTFQFCKDEACENKVAATKDGIAWRTDEEHKFVRGSDELFNKPQTLFRDAPITANTLLSDPDFVVWMRLAAFQDFDKLYYVITEDLVPGQSYFVLINPRYPVERFGGHKEFYISTTEWFGAPNPFLAVSYLVVGFVALFIATALLVKHIRDPRPPSYSDPDVVRRELEKLTLGNVHSGTGP